MKIMVAVRILFVTWVAAGLAYATTTGTIRGVTTDTTGAVIAGAQVTVVNEGTNETRRMATDSGGNFEFVLLPIGTYTLRVEHPNFKAYLLRGITLTVNQVATFQTTLQVGGVTSTVEVQANPIQVDTTATQVGTVIGSKPILDLPLNGRNLYQLVALQPGISVPGSAGGITPDPNNPIYAFRQVGAPLVFSSSGGRLVGNGFLVDGGDTRSLGENEAVIRIIPDAVQEFRVLTNTFNPEFGNAVSLVNIISKSGTNQWHGDAFEFFRNDVLNARNFFETARAPFKLNQFGGTLGGPIRKDKTFIFGSFQETRRRQGVSAFLSRVYSDSERTGNFSDRDPNGFSGSLSPTNPLPLCFPRDVPGASNCFAAGTPYSTIFPGAVIPTSFFDPVSQTILSNFIPRPNVGNEFLSASPIQPENDTQWTTKLDQELSTRHRLSVLYYFDDDTKMPFGLVPSDVPGFPVVTKERDQQINAAETWIVSPATVNELRFSVMRQSRGKEGNPLRVFSPASVGFTGVVVGPPTELQTLPVIKISGGPTFGSPTFGSGGGFDIQNLFQFSDNFSKVMGRHTLKFGGDVSRIHYDQEATFLVDGDFAFGGFGPNSTGDPFADFVLGLPDTYSQGAASFLFLRATQLNFYGQDTWHLRPNLTLNYGLRWELNTPFVEKNNELDTFRFPSAPGQPLPQSRIFPTAPAGFLFAGDPGEPRGLTQTYYRSFAPRIGLAYSPGAGKTVIRAAYGIFYNPAEESVLQQFNGEPPFGGSSIVSAPGFATPFLNQAGQLRPSPFPFVIPKPGDRVDFNKFLPILDFGDFLPDQRSQYMEQYNLIIERQLSPTLVASGGYVGTQGHRLMVSFDLNPGNPSLCLQLASQGCGPFGEDSNYVSPTGQTIFGTRPVGPLSNNGSIEAFSSLFFLHSIANSNYHSLQLRLERRASDLQFLASYTLSKSIDNASGFENLLNPFCYRCDRTLSGFDVRHRFVFSGTYRLPLQRLVSPSGIKGKFLGGWEVGGIVTFQSGVPVHVTDTASDNSLTGGFDFEPADRPDLVGPIRTQDPRHGGIAFSGAVVPNQFFGPNAFAVEKLGTIGNASHSLFRGPGINNVDFTIIKQTKLSERYTLEFRSEFFNMFNHAQFLNPSGDIGAGDDFGRVTSARDPRFIQFALKFLF